MQMQKNIEEVLKESLTVKQLIIINDSHHHAGHIGDDGSGETHFTVKIAAEELDSLPRLERHKTVKSLLKPLMKKGLHAISVQML